MGPGQLVLACRSLEKGQAALRKIAEDPGVPASTKLSLWQLDLEYRPSLRSFCQRVDAELSRLDGLLLNAGVEAVEFRFANQLEKSLAVNVVGTSYLAQALLPKLRSTASKNEVDVNLTIVGSCIHIFGPDDQLSVPEEQSILATLSDEKRADMSLRYNLSKLMIHLCFNEMAAEEASGGSNQIIMNLVNPGWCSTELARSRPTNPGEKGAFLIFGRTPEQGSRTLVHAITAGRETHGCYLSECKVKKQSAFVRSDRGRQIARRVWNDTQSQIQAISTGS
jgi:NAD(P)-dependent dehydrogenase (short-subunit alcohol dehydrogenase family)